MKRSTLFSVVLAIVLVLTMTVMMAGCFQNGEDTAAENEQRPMQSEKIPTDTRPSASESESDSESESETIPPCEEHTVSEWSVTKEATCAELGEESGVCTVCGATATKEIAKKTSHTVETWNTDKDATCKEPGSKSGTCSVCGEAVVMEIAQLTTHDVTDATCSVCGHKNWSKGLKFELNEDGESYYVSDYSNYQDLNVTIPAEYNGLPVTALGPRSFRDCHNITNVWLTKNITYIASGAFSNCYDLEYKEFDGAKYLSSCGWQPYVLIDITNHNITSFTVPLRTAFIYGGAFDGCNKLERVTFESDKLIQIGDSAFAGCYKLESMSSIPSTVKSIGSMAFSMTKITSLTIPSGIERVESDSFAGLPSTFNYNTQDGLCYVGTSSNPYYYLAKTQASREEVPQYPETYTVHANTRIIAQGAFSSVYAPNNVTRTIDLSATTNLTIIGKSAFKDCSSLRTITIPETVTHIDSYAFSGCTSLTEINIPASVKVIESEVFNGCTNLTITAAFTEAPSTWKSGWNSNRPVTWLSE